MFGDIGTHKEALGGTLKLFIQRGKLYRDTEAIGKMDPFVQVEYRDKKFRTKVIEEGGKEPVWN